MDYEKLFKDIFTKLAVFTENATIETELEAEIYKRKFVTGLMLGGKIFSNNKTNLDKSVYMSIYDVLAIEDRSDSLTVTRLPKILMEVVLLEVTKYTGLNYNDFLKLTLEETEVVLDVIDLKMSIQNATNKQLEDELRKEQQKEQVNDFDKYHGL